jgi:hypothetical protein
VTISPGLASNQWLRFQGLGLKIGSCGLVIWVTKSSRRFLGLSLKTKQATVYQLRHETNGRVTAWDTHQDLVASFAWKKVRVGFPSLASRLMEARRWVVHVAPSRRLHRSQVKNGRVDATGCVRPCYPLLCHFLSIMP